MYLYVHIVTIVIDQVHSMLRCTVDATFACVKLPAVHILLCPNRGECSGMIAQHTLGERQNGEKAKFHRKDWKKGGWIIYWLNAVWKMRKSNNWMNLKPNGIPLLVLQKLMRKKNKISKKNSFSKSAEIFLEFYLAWCENKCRKHRQFSVDFPKISSILRC